MFNRNAVVLSLLIVVAGFSFSFYRLWASRNHLQLANTVLVNDNNSLRLTQEVLANMVFFHGGLIAYQYDPDCRLTDAANTAHTMRDIVGGKKIVFQFAETNCFSCVETFFPFLDSLAAISHHNVVVIGAFEQPDHLFVKLHTYKLPVPVYNVLPALLPHGNSRMEVVNAPYVYVIDSALHVNNFFIPEKDMPELTSKYCQMVASLF